MNGTNTRIAIIFLGLMTLVSAISLTACSVLQVSPHPGLLALGTLAAGTLAAWISPTSPRPPGSSPPGSSAPPHA